MNNFYLLLVLVLKNLVINNLYIAVFGEITNCALNNQKQSSREVLENGYGQNFNKLSNKAYNLNKILIKLILTVINLVQVILDLGLQVNIFLSHPKLIIH